MSPTEKYSIRQKYGSRYIFDGRHLVSWPLDEGLHPKYNRNSKTFWAKYVSKGEKSVIEEFLREEWEPLMQLTFPDITIVIDKLLTLLRAGLGKDYEPPCNTCVERFKDPHIKGVHCSFQLVNPSSYTCWRLDPWKKYN